MVLINLLALKTMNKKFKAVLAQQTAAYFLLKKRA
jgi:hypothetical protein